MSNKTASKDSSTTANGMPPEDYKPTAESLPEDFRNAALTVAEGHKCHIDMHEPLEDGSIRIVMSGLDVNSGTAMGIALEVCAESGQAYTVGSIYVAANEIAAWLRPC